MSQHKQFQGDGIDIDAVHRTWPNQRGLFRKQRPVWREHPATWVMLALAVGFVVGLCVGVM